jgi:GLPGLI family protein
MQKGFVLFLSLLFVSLLRAQEPKVLSECTLVYDLSVEDVSTKAGSDKPLAGASKVVYIKGSKARTDLITSAFQQIIIYDSKTDTTVVLRELGNTKYLSYLDAKRRADQNKKFEGLVFSNTSETKTILGYECKKVEAKLKDGSIYNIYYAPSIIPSNKGYEYQFRDLPGFALEYEAQSEDGKNKVRYSASKITLTPVAEAKFDIPKAGYRVL